MPEYEVEVIFTVEAEDGEDARTIVTESCQAGVEANVLPSYEIRERAVTELPEHPTERVLRAQIASESPQQELDRLVAEFEAQGGRGVELAERIDRLRDQLAGTVDTFRKVKARDLRAGMLVDMEPILRPEDDPDGMDIWHYEYGEVVEVVEESPGLIVVEFSNGTWAFDAEEEVNVQFNP